MDPNTVLDNLLVWARSHQDQLIAQDLLDLDAWLFTGHPFPARWRSKPLPRIWPERLAAVSSPPDAAAARIALQRAADAILDAATSASAALQDAQRLLEGPP